MEDDRLRALTVRQPWATAIIWGGKDIENRSKPTKYRGRLWIHAGMHHPDWGDYLEVRGLSGAVFGWTDTRRVSMSAAEAQRAQRRKEHAGTRGVILGSVDVVGCHGDETAEDRESCSPWARHGQHHWMLANPQPLAEPVPCRGMLGLWRLPEDVEKAVRAQLEEQ
jgi:ASCH domain